MNDQSNRAAKVAEQLYEAFQFPFTGTPGYYFRIPPAGQAVEMDAKRKVYHCICCGEAQTVALSQKQPVHIANDMWAQQLELQEKYGADGQTLHEDGFCRNCFPQVIGEANAEEQLYMQAGWLLEQDRRLLQDLVSVADPNTREALLQKNLEEIRSVAAILQEVLTQLPERLTTYVAWPINHLQTVYEGIHNEYTVIIPEETTPEEPFYSLRSVEKTRVENFLALHRPAVFRFWAEAEQGEDRGE